MRYLLDTNVLMHLANMSAGYKRIEARMAKLDDGSFGISAISAIEIYRKLKNPRVNVANVERLKALYRDIQVYPFGKRAAEALVYLEQAMHGQHIGPADMHIAAHALAMKATCVSDNTEEFKRVPGLLLVNWRKPR